MYCTGASAAVCREFGSPRVGPPSESLVVRPGKPGSFSDEDFLQDPGMLTAKLSRPSFSFLTVCASMFSAMLADGRAAELLVGGATVSITPDRPVALAGQMHTRVSRAVESPVTATALALESREGDK